MLARDPGQDREQSDEYLLAVGAVNFFRAVVVVDVRQRQHCCGVVDDRVDSVHERGVLVGLERAGNVHAVENAPIGRDVDERLGGGVAAGPQPDRVATLEQELVHREGLEDDSGVVVELDQGEPRLERRELRDGDRRCIGRLESVHTAV